MNDKQTTIYNNIVDFLENSDTICKEDNKWFAIGYLEALRMQNILKYNECYQIIRELVETDVI